MKPHKEFTAEISEELNNYVYRLIDPRNGKTFYVGRGKGNRVFAHVNEEEKWTGGEETEEMKKLFLIRDIRLDGFEVMHLIHRHHMDEGTARAVESALIDAYPGLVNLVRGDDSKEYGIMHTDQIIQKYGAKVAVFHHKLLLVCVNNSSGDRPLYDATRFAWGVNAARVRTVEYVLAVRQGIIKEVYKPEKWHDATVSNFPRLAKEDLPKKMGFDGEKPAPDQIRELYVGKRVERKFSQKGFMYVEKKELQALHT